MSASTFHAARLTDSPRLQAVLAYLRESGTEGATTLGILRNCPTTRPSSDVSELRANGIDVRCEYEGRSDRGAKVYRYTLIN